MAQFTADRSALGAPGMGIAANMISRFKCPRLYPITPPNSRFYPTTNSWRTRRASTDRSSGSRALRDTLARDEGGRSGWYGRGVELRDRLRWQCEPARADE